MCLRRNRPNLFIFSPLTITCGATLRRVNEMLPHPNVYMSQELATRETRKATLKQVRNYYGTIRPRNICHANLHMQRCHILRWTQNSTLETDGGKSIYTTKVRGDLLWTNKLGRPERQCNLVLQTYEPIFLVNFITNPYGNTQFVLDTLQRNTLRQQTRTN